MVMTPRIYLPPEQQTEPTVRLDPEQSQYLCQALRLRPGDEMIVFDGLGNRRKALLERVDRKAAGLALAGELPGMARPSLNITLVQGVATGDRMDWIIEKAVEVGVARIVPVLCERGDVRLSSERAAKRGLHWQRIAVAACRQSGRDDLPVIEPPNTFSQWLTTGPLPAVATHGGFVMAPGNATSLATRLRACLDAEQPAPTHITLLVGPESGLSDTESGAAVSMGFAAAGLGPRVLRTETAGLVAATIAQSVLGDLR